MRPSRQRRAVSAAMIVLLVVGLLPGTGGALPPAGGGSPDHTRTPPDEPAKGLRYRGLARSAACGQGFQVVGRIACTHGPDPYPAGVTAASPAPAVDPATAAATGSVPCLGNGTSGKRVEVIYGVESGDTNRYSSVLSTIRSAVAQADGIASASGMATGEDRHLRVVTDSACNVVVRNVTLPAGSLVDFSTSSTALYNLGYSRDDRKYLLFADSNQYCGIGDIYGDDTKGAGNDNNGFIATYARVDVACWDGHSAIHELTHNMGAVQMSAPHTSGGWHCTDEYDVMCYSDEPDYPAMQYLCPDVGAETILDCGHDDYFHTDPPAGNYLATHWNVADSEFLAGSEGTDFVPITPRRVVDTRGTGTGDWWGALGTRGTLTAHVANVSGVPALADAVVVNLTVTKPTTNTFLTVYPGLTARPTASSINVRKGETRAVLLTAKVGNGYPGSGWLQLYNEYGHVDAVLDVVGYYAHTHGNRFVPLAPTRILDSRTGTGGYSTPWGSGSRTVSAGSAVPAGATAVALNLTATRPTATSFVTAFKQGASRPWTSNLNVAKGTTVPNLVVVQVDTARRFALYNYLGSVHLVADVVGYFVPPVQGAEFVPLAPVRILDSRYGNGTSGAFAAGESRSIQIAGRGGVPSNASGVVVTLTATRSTYGGFATMWPYGGVRPVASSINFVGGQTVANTVMARLGTGGKVNIRNDAGSTHYIADVVGYFK